MSRVTLPRFCFVASITTRNTPVPVFSQTEAGMLRSGLQDAGRVAVPPSRSGLGLRPGNYVLVSHRLTRTRALTRVMSLKPPTQIC